MPASRCRHLLPSQRNLRLLRVLRFYALQVHTRTRLLPTIVIVPPCSDASGAASGGLYIRVHYPGAPATPSLPFPSLGILRLTPLQTAGAHSANTDCSSQRTVDACCSVQFCAWDKTGSVCDYSSSTDGQINKNLFVVLSFCYQFGVLISRSSLNYVKVCPAPSHLLLGRS